MIDLARGSIFLGAAVLLVALFYFQPKAEAKNAFVEANNSQTDIAQTFIKQENIQQNNQTNIQEELINPEPSEPAAANSKSNNTNLKASAFKATAYCLKGRTASGGSVRRGIVAADPRVLPLGTRIQMNAGSYSGTYTVADTGGVIKGRILDIWVPNCSEAIRFGRKTVTVSVLNRNGR